MFLLNVFNVIFYFNICFLILKLLIPILRKHLISNPKKRDSHKIAKPTGGGIAILLSISIYIFVENIFLNKNLSNLDYLILCSMPISVLGLLDDKFNIKPSIRYFFQFIVVSLLIISSNPFDFSLKIDDISILNICIIFFSIFTATAIINFTNFMDGLDGLVCGVSIVLFSYFAISYEPKLWVVVGILLGFLRLNWSPSKVFMGDSGSTFIGALIVCVTLNTKSIDQMLEVIILCTPLLADSASCVIRRFSKNQNIFQAHKSHLYQRLNQAGWSHANVSKLYIFSTLTLTVVAFYCNLLVLILIAFLEILIGVYLDKKVAVKFISN